MGKLAELLAHPNELMPMVRMYLAAKQVKKLPKDPDLAFCFGVLNAVSRSFSIVINQLPSELRDATCVFYLVLRALDTVEDDMGIDVGEKVEMLKAFHRNILKEGFTLSYGTEHYQRLLKEFPKVHRVLMTLDPKFRDVICDITKRMGDGMAEFIEKEVMTVADYDLYCYYVAGLVGVGLSQLFAISSLEKPELKTQLELARHMGLFLQKTNIVRDYLEDIMEEPMPRIFWPKEIWSRYTPQLEQFKSKEHRTNGLKCLNHLVVNALNHIPFCLEYLEMIQHPDNFRFCAIPQVMAIATAALCFNNGDVFEGVVKVRRGQTCKIFEELHSMSDVYRMFGQFIDQIAAKVPEAIMEDDVQQDALKIINRTRSICTEKLKATSTAAPVIRLTPAILIMLLAVVMAVVFYTFIPSGREGKA